MKVKFIGIEKEKKLLWDRINQVTEIYPKWATIEEIMSPKKRFVSQALRDSWERGETSFYNEVLGRWDDTVGGIPVPEAETFTTSKPSPEESVFKPPHQTLTPLRRRARYPWNPHSPYIEPGESVAFMPTPSTLVMPVSPSQQQRFHFEEWWDKNEAMFDEKITDQVREVFQRLHQEVVDVLGKEINEWKARMEEELQVKKGMRAEFEAFKQELLQEMRDLRKETTEW